MEFAVWSCFQVELGFAEKSLLSLVFSLWLIIFSIFGIG